MKAEKVRIRRSKDNRCWIVQELSQGINRKTGKMSEPYWKDSGYYGKVEDIVKALISQKIDVPDGTLIQQMKEFIAELKKVEKRLAEEIKEELE